MAKISKKIFFEVLHKELQKNFKENVVFTSKELHKVSQTVAEKLEMRPVAVKDISYGYNSWCEQEKIESSIVVISNGKFIRVPFNLPHWNPIPLESDAKIINFNIKKDEYWEYLISKKGEKSRFKILEIHGILEDFLEEKTKDLSCGRFYSKGFKLKVDTEEIEIKNIQLEIDETRWSKNNFYNIECKINNKNPLRINQSLYPYLDSLNNTKIKDKKIFGACCNFIETKKDLKAHLILFNFSSNSQDSINILKNNIYILHI